MIKKIGLVNQNGKRLILELARPNLSGIAVKDIDGLGSVTSAISTGVQAVGDGSYVTRTRVEERTITLTLDYTSKNNSAETVEDIREMLYKYATPSNAIRLQIRTDNRQVYIDGVVASFKTKIFAHQAETTIEIKCPDPYFYGYEASYNIPVILSTVSSGVVSALGSAITIPNTGDLACGIEVTISNIDTSNVTSVVIGSTKQQSSTFGCDIGEYLTKNSDVRPSSFTYNSTFENRKVTFYSSSSDSDSDGLYALLYSNSANRWYNLPVGGDGLVAYANTLSEDTIDPLTVQLTYNQKYLGV